MDERAVNFAEYFRICGAPKTAETRCAPLVAAMVAWQLMSRFRSAISPWFDHREQIDVIRDRLGSSYSPASSRVALIRLPAGTNTPSMSTECHDVR